MLARFQRGGGGWGGGESGERVSAAVRAFGEMVKQSDSGGLLFERLPACQFRCNVFIDSLLSATWQPCRGSTFPVPHQKLRVCETGSLENLGKKSPPPPPVLCCLRNDGRLAMFMLLTQKRNALGLTVHIFWIQRVWLCTKPIFHLRVHDMP